MMNTETNNTIVLPPQLFSFLNQESKKFGVSVIEYVKYLAIRDAKKVDERTFADTEETEWKKWEAKLPVYTATEKKWKEWDKGEAEMSQDETETETA